MKKFIEQMKYLFSLHGLIAMVLASLAFGYFLMGIDLIPDSIPVVGYLDDVLLILASFFAGGYIARMVMGKEN